MGIAFCRIIDDLIKLAKGEIVSQRFFTLFCNRPVVGIPSTIEKFQVVLQQAWWIEEQDVKQHLLMETWRHKLSSQSELDYVLERHLRDYLIYNQKVFSRQICWQEDYRQQLLNIYQQQQQQKQQLLLPMSPMWSDKLSLFDRYLLYLSCILELPRQEIANILLSQNRQVNRFQLTLQNKMENLNVQS